MRVLLLLSRFLLLAVIVLLLYWALRPRPDFMILVDDDEIRIRGRFPKALQDKLIHFLREDVLLRGHVRISGRRRRDGYLSVDFQGPVFQEDRQRIRNFLINMF